MTDEPAPVTEGGLKLAETPLGRAPVPNVTVPPKPPDGVTVTVKVVPCPRSTVCEAGAALP